MNKIVGKIACILLTLVSYSALANMVTFDFRKPDGQNKASNGYTAGPLVFTSTDGAHTVSASAWSEYGTPWLASSQNYGLYIYTCTSRCNDNTHQIDGSGPNEGVKLDFGQKAQIKYATFSYIDGDDDFTLYVDGQKKLDDVDPGDSFWSTYSFTGDKSFDGSIFKFLADHSSDDFKLKKVGVHIIPIPASLLLFLSAFAGLGLIARGRRLVAA